MTSSKLYLRLLGYVRPYWRAFALALLAMALVAALEPALPALMKPLLDGTFVERDPRVIQWMPIAILLIVALRGIGTYLGTYAITWVGNKVVADLRQAMFARLLTLSSPYYENHATGSMLSKVTYDVAQVTQAATSVVTIVVKDVLTIVGLIAWMLWLDWQLTLLALIMGPVIVQIVRLASARLRTASREAQRAMGDMTQILEEAIDGQREVKLFGGQDYEATRFGRTGRPGAAL